MQTQAPLEWGNGKKRQKVRGSIVNIASQLGMVGRPDAPAYCASKAAVIAFTRGDAIDVGD
jgi:NAD(P)-dependent dehydrogenase (short-subunit alcohol dehydrogenase family)